MEQKLSPKQIALAGGAILIIIIAGIFIYRQSKKSKTTPAEERPALTQDEKSAIEARINSAPAKELTPEEKSAIEARINSAPAKELTPEEKSAIEARINNK